MNRGHATPDSSSRDGDFEPVKSRHCYVNALGHGELARLPGLLLARKRDKGGWMAYVILVEPDGGVRQTWVRAESVEVA